MSGVNGIGGAGSVSQIIALRRLRRERNLTLCAPENSVFFDFFRTRRHQDRRSLAALTSKRSAVLASSFRIFRVSVLTETRPPFLRSCRRTTGVA